MQMDKRLAKASVTTTGFSEALAIIAFVVRFAFSNGVRR